MNLDIRTGLIQEFFDSLTDLLKEHVKKHRDELDEGLRKIQINR
jgi:hypothetical protein